MLEGGRARLEKLADLLGDHDNGDTASFVVRGRLVSNELRGLAGVRVVAVDKNVSGDVSLGEGMSRERGAYGMRYSVADLQKD